MTEQRKKFTLKSIFNPLTLVTASVLLVGLVLISLVILFLGRNPTPSSAAIPEMTMIAAPTLTPRVVDPTPVPTAMATPGGTWKRHTTAIGTGGLQRIF